MSKSAIFRCDKCLKKTKVTAYGIGSKIPDERDSRECIRDGCDGMSRPYDNVQVVE